MDLLFLPVRIQISSVILLRATVSLLSWFVSLLTAFGDLSIMLISIHSLIIRYRLCLRVMKVINPNLFLIPLNLQILLRILRFPFLSPSNLLLDETVLGVRGRTPRLALAMSAKFFLDFVLQMYYYNAYITNVGGLIMYVVVIEFPDNSHFISTELSLKECHKLIDSQFNVLKQCNSVYIFPSDQVDIVVGRCHERVIN